MKLKTPKERQCRKCGETFIATMAIRQCTSCRSLKQTVPVRTTHKKKSPKSPSKSKLKKELDRVYSIYIRQSYADVKGLVKCVSCGTKKHWKEMQNGHYVSRSNMWLRWDERNTFPQCVSCNVFKSGNYPAYTQYLLRRFGTKWLINLVKEAEQIKKWTPNDIQERIDFYKKKIKDI